jgi:hypothetical protein
MRKRKMTDGTLSPCLTPTSIYNSAFSFPILIMTLRLVFSLLMLSQNFVGGGVLLQYFEHLFVVVSIRNFDRGCKDNVSFLVMLLLKVENGV